MYNKENVLKRFSMLPMAVLAALIAFVLIGQGCAAPSDTTGVDEVAPTAERTQVLGDSGDFSLSEGIMTEQGFDMLSEAYETFLEEEDILGTPDPDGFDMWRSVKASETLPINDAYKNSVELILIDGGYQLWSEGKDKLPNTADDYWKNYAY